MKKRILFLIHDLGPGGAEKVLVNLVNGMDREQFDISVRTLFDYGPNRQFLAEDVHYSSWIGRDIPGNSHLMKILSPKQLYKMIIPESYDIVVSYLEGPCARVVSGCPKDGTKVVCWIHTAIPDQNKFTEGFRNYNEAVDCYNRAEELVFVSEDVKDAFMNFMTPENRIAVLHNVYNSSRIREQALKEQAGLKMDPDQMNWCGVGKLIPLKGWPRMLKIQRRLMNEGFPAHFYLIGDGPDRDDLQKLAEEIGVADSVTFTGYQTNPYAWISRCMLMVCASEREGFSTAVVESLLMGTPVCTVDVGGMREILGKNNEYGIVTDNDDEALYQGIRKFFADPEHGLDYKQRAIRRGNSFNDDQTINAVEKELLSL